MVTNLFSQSKKGVVSSLLLLFILFPGTLISTADVSGSHYGMLIMAGGRYDNMRMCVATPAGVKGGPIADVMVTGRYTLSDGKSFGFNLPVMRPILFGLAFKMLQFEPEMVLDIGRNVNEKVSFVSSPSLGISFHYGPDYKSDRKNRTPSFFAMGPIAGFHIGFAFNDEKGKKRFAGIKPFYSVLFSKDKGTGNVVGGVLEYQRD